MDEVLLNEVADGATQAVLLGAGLDSRFYRLRDELGDAALFEVDHPVTAAVKAERLEAIFGEHARPRSTTSTSTSTRRTSASVSPPTGSMPTPARSSCGRE